MTSLSLTIPGIPPSGNHYKQPSVRRGQIHYHLTRQAAAFYRTVAILAAGATVSPATTYLRSRVRYALTAVVYLGKGQSGDGDNFWKCLADSLVKAKVIHSDARVKVWHLVVEETDRSNPRTEVTVEVL